MEDSFEATLKDLWEASSESLIDRLRTVQTGLVKWAKVIKGRKVELKKKFTVELETLMKEDRDDEILAKIIDTKLYLNIEIEKDEVYWEQRARVNWLRHGDRNTAFFHNCVAARKRANFISKLTLDSGQEINEESIIQEEAMLYFENLFTSKGVADPKEILEGIEGNISDEINRRLQAPFREDEVRAALKGMGPIKAPGPDGFPAIFFQKFWHIVGKEVLEFCLGVLNEGREAEAANMTNIVLIPKVNKPTSLVSFRLISLCNVVYKIIAKTIANRMQDVMAICIDQVQSAFVPGRLISDNIVLAYELLHTFRQKRTGKKGYMAVKLDMSKAYDRVEWGFLQGVMVKMGFPSTWIELIMRCVTSVSYAVTINGKQGRIFKPTRGLRQGDPLSPFLFLICSEGLSALMRNAKKKGSIRGVKASRSGKAISHLLFADDCLIFGEATEKGARVLKDILKVYEDCSGQCVNFDKSLIFYSSNTDEVSKAAVLRLLGVRSSSSPEKYLGLPNMVGRRKKEAFQNMADRISACIENWSSRLYPLEGRKFSSNQFFRQFLLSLCHVFFFLKCYVQRLRVFWHGSGGRRDMGKGAFIGVSGTKQGWRLLTLPDSLVARVLKAKYFPENSFLQSQLRNSGSYIWRSIWATKGVLEKGLVWKVGSGANISICQDNWIPGYVHGRLLSRFANLQYDKVAELISISAREWNKDLIVNTFPEDVADLILRIPLAMEPHEDFLVWSGEPSGVFSVRSSYKLLQNWDPTAYALHNNYRVFYRKLWRVDIPNKIKMFTWKLLWNYIATKANLYARRLGNNNLCPWCWRGEETLTHLFQTCPVSDEIWRALPDMNLTSFQNLEFSEWLTSVMDLLSLERCRLFCIALWSIWGDRNSRMHDKITRSSQDIARFINSYLQELDGIKINNLKRVDEQRKWQNPPKNRLKINFDGAFDGRNKLSTSGVVVRDNRGNVISSSAVIHKGVQNAFEAEALTRRRATQVALDMDKEGSIVEGDSLSVIKKCQNPERDKSQLSLYIFDIHQMKLRNRSLKHEFIHRSANNLAHVIAVESLRQRKEFYLLNRVPDFAVAQARDESEREPD
ncbi:reverse transcriptase [Gossypium australe]|uniref:Reverse transcriptase n=1 Tax=Gossypium australe TaxID=47621 RepID=A0A5B6VTM0_9ROSI|nr:reverse transcriptase [Gossypium australe]